ncbi:MAG TPA: hypothetical protein VFE65_25310 [Pseudonocardia sp.]|nr:hypothetical protein [Pseudonocardia sp.]
MAEVQAIRVFRGIYNAFAVAMSEAEEGLRFNELPSSDELAASAFDLTQKLIADDQRETIPEAQQEFTATVVTLALLEHRGDTEEVTQATVQPALEGLWKLIGGRWVSD